MYKCRLNNWHIWNKIKNTHKYVFPEHLIAHHQVLHTIVAVSPFSLYANELLASTEGDTEIFFCKLTASRPAAVCMFSLKRPPLFCVSDGVLECLKPCWEKERERGRRGVTRSDSGSAWSCCRRCECMIEREGPSLGDGVAAQNGLWWYRDAGRDVLQHQFLGTTQ